MKQLLLDIKPAAAPSLQNFVAGRNAEAIASLSAALSSHAQPRFIYLWGEAGSGKSYLLSACEAIGARVADDVHLLDNEAQIDLFNTYNQLKETGGILITAGLHAPAQMNLRNDLATRLAWGLVYQLHPLNDDEKATALKPVSYTHLDVYKRQVLVSSPSLVCNKSGNSNATIPLPSVSHFN